MSSWGFRVEDPCKAVDNTQRISLASGNTAQRDFRYHEANNSTFWLRQCTGFKAIRFTKTYSFLDFTNGILKVLSTPPDICSKIEIKHAAPDHSTVTNVFYLKMLDQASANIEKCSPTPFSAQCYPKLEELQLKAIAGQKKSVVLYKQDSIGKFLTECRDALFSLKDGPSWLTLQEFSSLEINAPNEVSAVGTYHFYLAIWRITLTVDPPCDANYLGGLEEQGTVQLHIDEKVVLHV